MLKYCIDETAEKPIMLLDTHIGYDEEDGQGVDGAEFSRELLFLDSLGKKSIDIWVCSPGGIVEEAMKIYSTMLMIKAKVDTVGTGIIASSAAIVFQAGRKRTMMDFAFQMYHNASGGDSNKGREQINNSIAIMIAGRSGKTVDEVRNIMSVTSYINAEMCKTQGLCDDVEYCSDLNKPRLVPENGIKAMMKEALSFTNKAKEDFKPKNKMKKVTNKLGLNDDASEESIYTAIDKLEVSNKANIEAVNTLKESVKAKDEEITTLKNKVTEFENSQKTAADKAKADQVAAEEKEAADLLADGVKVGKIENKAEVIEKWKNQFKANHTATKEIFELLPAAKKEGANFKNKLGKDENGDAVVPYSAAGQMAKIANRNREKATA